MHEPLTVECLQAPDVSVQRQILEAKKAQLQAQGYESLLNVRLNEVQLPGASPPEKLQLEREVKAQLHNGRQCYVAAAECQKLLDALAEPALAAAG
jgi:hypothetical protein